MDTNVFNDTIDPKQDTTAAIGPAADVWIRLGRSRLSGKTSAQYLYFNKYDRERTWNWNEQGKWDVPFARLTPFVAASYVNAKERRGFEIDSRVRQHFNSVGLGTDLRLSGKTNVVFTGSRSSTEYGQSQTVLGTDLATALNHTTDTEGIQDRFDLNPLRSANSLRVLPGFELKPSALISGSVFVGYRRLAPLDSTIPAFDGLNAAVSAKYVAGSTQFDGRVERDVTYSYQDTQPYYTLTDLGLTITQRITHAWDIVGRGSRQTLDYQALRSAAETGQVDRIRQYGGGIGYRVGRTMRLGFDASYYRRTSSSVVQADYEGLRVGASVSYGLPQ